jgi:hypothetical protein
VQGRPPGSELADLAVPSGDGIYTIAFPTPPKSLQGAHVRASVADMQGNVTRVDVRFSLSFACACDFDSSGALNSQDFFDFLVAFFAADPRADFNASGAIDSQDFFDFLSCFFVGCA